MTREESLNNPGGIKREPGTTWQGQAPDQPDPVFVKFLAAPYGIRALVKVLETYQARDGVHSVAAAITRWAPPGENDTGAYLADVCQRLNMPLAQASLPIDLATVMPHLVAAIINHENGEEIYSSDEIASAISLA